MTRRSRLTVLTLGALRAEYRAVCRRRRISSLEKTPAEWTPADLIDEICRIEAERPLMTVVRFT